MAQYGISLKSEILSQSPLIECKMVTSINRLFSVNDSGKILEDLVLLTDTPCNGQGKSVTPLKCKILKLGC